jgi:nucleotide-binding universal stress UspA family protein
VNLNSEKGAYMPASAAPVVVGVDGTEKSIHAARWAGGLAERLGSPLHIVHAKSYPRHSLTEAGATARAVEMAEQDALAETILRTAATAARAKVADVPITTEQLHESADAALIDISRRARLIVVGCDEVTPGGAVLIGSMTLAVAAGSVCPLIAWRGEAVVPNEKPIVLGVDNHGDSDAAVATAFELADRMAIEIVAVHAWSARRSPGDVTLPSMIDWAAVEDDHRTRLSNALQPWMERYPDVKVTCVVEATRPDKALLAHTDNAQIVAVGSRSRGLLSVALLGSTGLNLLHHSAIPVLICRPSGGPG